MYFMGAVLSSSVLASPSPLNTGFPGDSFLGRVIRPGSPSHPLPLVLWSAPARNPHHALVYSHLSERLVPEVMKTLIDFLQNDAEIFFVRATTEDGFRVWHYGERLQFRCFVVPTLNKPTQAAVANCLYLRDLKAQRFLQELLEAAGFFGATLQCKRVQNSLVLIPH